MDWYKWRRDWLGIDVGSAGIRICFNGQIVFNEPSMIAVTKDGQLVAVGLEAMKLAGRTPQKVMTIEPIGDGRVKEPLAAQIMLREMIRKCIGRSRFTQLIATTAISAGCEEQEKDVLRTTLRKAGLEKIVFLDTSMAAAVGVGMMTEHCCGQLVVDIGAKRSEAAVIACADVVCRTGCAIGGDRFDEDLIGYLRNQCGLLVGRHEAKNAKEMLATLEGNEWIEIKGRDRLTGLPRAVRIEASALERSLKKSFEMIVEMLKGLLEQTPPELVSDIMKTGIVLTGGGSQLAGIAMEIESKVNLRTRVADNPKYAVIKGIYKSENGYEAASELKVAK